MTLRASSLAHDRGNLRPRALATTVLSACLLIVVGVALAMSGRLGVGLGLVAFALLMYVAASRRIARSTGRRSIEFGSTPSELRQLILITACGMVAFAALGAVSILTADGSSVLAAISFSVAAMGALAMSRFISLRSAVRRSSGLMHPGEVALAMCIGQGETFLTSAVVLATDRRILGLQAGLLRSPEMVASLAYSEVDTVDGGVDHVDIRGENSRVSITKGMPQQVNEFVKVLNAQLAAGGSDSTSFRI